MKYIFFLVFSCISLTSFCQANGIAGHWLGSLNANLRLIIHFNVDANGKLTATLDSPDQGASGIKSSAVSLTGDSVRMEISAAKIVYLGKIISDTSITGIWQQGAGSAPLNFSRVEKFAAFNRPQTPGPPFDYMVEDVEYDNADRSAHLAGTLTWPKGGGKFAAALLITGSGQQDRDETIFDHKPFAVLTDYLTKQGIAVLRVDDRGIGNSTGELATATSADFAKDVQGGINYLKSRSEIDTKKIGFIGHSEGGIIAPMVAANNKDVAFIVLWGAPIIGGAQINTEQNAYALQKAGFKPPAINAFKELHREVLNDFKIAADTTLLNEGVKKIYDQWRQKQPDSILKSLYANETFIVGQNVYKMYDGLYAIPWMRFFIAHDFAADLANVKCKVLAVNGSLDTQVDAVSNLSAIDSILTKNNNTSFKTVSLPGLNHLLQTAITGDDKEYGKIEETMAPAALALIASWINTNVNSKHK